MKKPKPSGPFLEGKPFSNEAISDKNPRGGGSQSNFNTNSQLDECRVDLLSRKHENTETTIDRASTSENLRQI